MKLDIRIALFALFCVPMCALSCSPIPGKPSVNEAYENSENVYLAFAQSIVTKESKDKSGHKIVTQVVIFRVLETWKGNYKVGQQLNFQTTLFDGSCGVGATNEPGWLEQESEDGNLNDHSRYPRLSGIWVIYEGNTTQHQLNHLGRTSPLEYGGSEDLKILYQLQKNKYSH